MAIRRQKNLALYGVLIGCGVVVAAFLLVLFTYILPASNYSAAEKAFASGDYFTAQSKYRAAGKYQDADSKAILAEKRRL